MNKQCKAYKKNGARCPSAAGADGYCFAHDPAKVADRQAARLKGGYNRRTVARVSGEAVQISTLADILKLINAVILDTWAQENNAGRSRALLGCADSAMKVLQVSELDKRLSEIEAALGIADKTTDTFTDKGKRE